MRYTSALLPARLYMAQFCSVNKSYNRRWSKTFKNGCDKWGNNFTTYFYACDQSFLVRDKFSFNIWWWNTSPSMEVWLGRMHTSATITGIYNRS